MRPFERAMFSWLAVGTVFVLCGVLGVLQYRWIGEVSNAERERLRGSLQASLNRLSEEFNSEITTVCAELLPVNAPSGEDDVEAGVAARYRQWNQTTRHGRIFRRIVVAVPREDEDTVVLRMLDLDRGVFASAEWPEEWWPLRDRIEARPRPGLWRDRRPPGPPPEDAETTALLELPLRGVAPGGPFPPFERRETGWLVLELNLEYVRDFLLPELLQRHLRSGGNLDYQVSVVARGNPHAVIYQSEPGEAERIAAYADASVGLLELQFDRFFRRRMPPGPPGADRRLLREPAPDLGRWQMYVRHHAGSLEAAVNRVRWRNLAVTACVLLLMAGSLAGLIRSARSARKLADLQMDFVAGVSHELRTPLTVIQTAAYNLRGKMGGNPAQVERYGALIQQECGRLRELVEHVLRFSSARAGRVIQATEPVSIETLIDESLESSQAVVQRAGCVVEKSVEPRLPLVMADAVALKQVFDNLLSNAAKYGAEDGHWIGVTAAGTGGAAPGVEIRVADRGPGIPADEQPRVFDAFFRGRRAVQDQVHGTGLGLNLVKKIVEAHGGTVGVESAPGQGTAFIVRLPAAPAECQDEFADTVDRG